MSRLEVFFDYICPYCLRGHEYLVGLINDYPMIEIIWRPCESHPRPERCGAHSDLCIQGMFYAIDQGADIWEYHKIMYKAAQIDRINIENLDTLADSVKGFLDSVDYHEKIQSGKYINKLRDANQYAFEQSGVWAVPAYRMNGKKLDSIEDVGITKMQLSNFICGASVHYTK